MKDLAYKDRYVAFIDILGFKGLIERSVASPPKISLQQIIKALQFTPPVSKDKIILGRIGDISKSDHQMSSFSDNVFISTAQDENGLMHIIHHAGQISFNLLKLGFLCRGGITKGLCYHHDNVVFGPAVVEAHNIENEIAKYPRVVLSESVLADGENAPPPVGEIFKSFIRKDTDSRYYVHYLRIIRQLSDSMERSQPQDYLEMLSGIKRMIEKELILAPEKETIDKKVRKVPESDKIKWIKEYFDFTTGRSHLDLLNTPFP